jgi:hypothetical protein
VFAIREAVVAELGKGRRISGDERAELTADVRRRYEAGTSIRSLAESTGRSYGFIHRLLAESGVPMRSRGGATRGKKAP